MLLGFGGFLVASHLAIPSQKNNLDNESKDGNDECNDRENKIAHVTFLYA